MNTLEEIKMNIRRSCISAEWACSTDTSTLSAPGYETSEDVHMNGMVLNLKESGLYSNQVKKGQVYKQVLYRLMSVLMGVSRNKRRVS